MSSTPLTASRRPHSDARRVPSTASASINYWKDGHVGFIEMDDPPANTYTHEMMRQLDDAILDARFDSDVEVIVLTGKGEKFFSAGANIGMLNAVTPEFKYMFCLHANETLNRLEQTPKLVIAALNGHTVGGGLEIAMAADIRIARQDAGKIGLPEVALGVLPGTGGTQRLVASRRQVSRNRTDGHRKTVSFEQALDWGIVNDIYEGNAKSSARQMLDYAKQFCSPNKAPMAVGHIKRSVQTGCRAAAPRRARARTRAAIAALQERRRQRRLRRVQRKARR